MPLSFSRPNTTEHGFHNLNDEISPSFCNVETFLVHFFGTGLADDRYVVEAVEQAGLQQLSVMV